MKLVVGLGNPGARYTFTRHNSGFLALDYYLKRYGGSFKESGLLGAFEGVSDDFVTLDERVLVVTPQGFYNGSGRVVAEYVRYYKLAPTDVLVICDNFDLEFGTIRYKTSGSAGGNNGLKSIDTALGTTDYARIRIGTKNLALKEQMGAMEFVLSKFTPEEKRRLPEILEKVANKIQEFICE
ncbi:aminoacyl-tRNA hydrolase [Candidatus Saccharibacteria bacterium]|nr:aminoacyl-tRNA hydrolase [Candidatus Saccharibacteria bacterium]